MMENKENKFEVVFSTHNRGLISLAKSLLEDNEIEYYVKNETLNNTFGSGILLGGYDPIISPIEFLVSDKCISKAKLILKDLSDK